MRNRSFRPGVAQLNPRISPTAGIVIIYGPLDPIMVGDPNPAYSTSADPNLVVNVDQTIQYSSGHQTGYDPACPPILH